jgi:hypothetical protein
MSRLIYCYAECHYAECRYAECCYAECRGADLAGKMGELKLAPKITNEFLKRTKASTVHLFYVSDKLPPKPVPTSLFLAS